jgi:predicted 3-demethylubiquinone-9 3-methyltransferase (glyoxalase superfamily)
MFQEGNAEEALNFYTSVIPDSRIEAMERYDASGPGPEGTVFRATFSVAGQTVLCTDSFVKHDFSFTPSFSFFVECASEAQQSELVARLAEGGSLLMPLDSYGFSRRFAWVADRFGVSWQLNLA